MHNLAELKFDPIKKISLTRVKAVPTFSKCFFYHLQKEVKYNAIYKLRREALDRDCCL